MENEGKSAQRGTGGRRRRPVVVAKALEDRKARQLERAVRVREREQRINAAERDFVAAWETIAVCNHDLSEALASLEQRAQEARDRAGELIGVAEQKQADAAARIRAEGCGVDEIADILQIKPARVRTMLAEKRRSQDSDEQSGGRGQRPRPESASPARAASSATSASSTVEDASEIGRGVEVGASLEDGERDP